MNSQRTTRRSQRSNQLFVIVAFVLFVVQNAFGEEQRVLRVAADPNNLPFSNDRLEGFENKIAELIARELHYKIEYHWRAQRRGFFRETLKNGDVDLVMGVPAHFDMALTTAPYYRSSYVFVSRVDGTPHVVSFDDPQLRSLKVGVQLIGNDGVDTPPAHALASRGIVNNVVGFTLYGDYSQRNPPARVIDAVANGDVDIAIAWGPLAGYFAKKSKIPLEITPVTPEQDGPLRFAFDVSLGINKKERELRDQLDVFLTNHREAINGILDSYNIPRATRETQLTSAK
jgi:quinoprotein dehydrogenase-associated probable ABC transporter substrate-binding protein